MGTEVVQLLAMLNLRCWQKIQVEKCRKWDETGTNVQANVLKIQARNLLPGGNRNSLGNGSTF